MAARATAPMAANDVFILNVKIEDRVRAFECGHKSKSRMALGRIESLKKGKQDAACPDSGRIGGNEKGRQSDKKECGEGLTKETGEMRLLSWVAVEKGLFTVCSVRFGAT